ncbi:hypothetical protein Bbelb_082400 [Branchiostoma belcheri]|nr:hypothetical protein Bbelb_082400 [Branchiostoma belcheri]
MKRHPAAFVNEELFRDQHPPTNKATLLPHKDIYNVLAKKWSSQLGDCKIYFRPSKLNEDGKQTEDIMIREALHVFKQWNPLWKPSHFMVNFSEAEMGALEDKFQASSPRLRLYMYLSLPASSPRLRLYLSLPASSPRLRLYLSLPASSPRLRLYLSLPASSPRLRLYLSLPVSSPRLRLYLSLPASSPRLRLYLSLPACSVGLQLCQCPRVPSPVMLAQRHTSKETAQRSPGSPGKGVPEEGWETSHLKTPIFTSRYNSKEEALTQEMLEIICSSSLYVTEKQLALQVYQFYELTVSDNVFSNGDKTDAPKGKDHNRAVSSGSAAAHSQVPLIDDENWKVFEHAFIDWTLSSKIQDKEHPLPWINQTSTSITVCPDHCPKTLHLHMKAWVEDGNSLILADTSPPRLPTSDFPPYLSVRPRRLEGHPHTRDAGNHPLGGVCSHVTALSFAMEASNSLSEQRPSCTSKKAVWSKYYKEKEEPDMGEPLMRKWGFGLGFFGEQGIEATHKDFTTIRIATQSIADRV